MEGSDTLVWSWVISFENDKHPKPDRRDEIAVGKPDRSERAQQLLIWRNELDKSPDKASPHWMLHIWHRRKLERRRLC